MPATDIRGSKLQAVETTQPHETSNKIHVLPPSLFSIIFPYKGVVGLNYRYTPEYGG